MHRRVALPALLVVLLLGGTLAGIPAATAQSGPGGPSFLDYGFQGEGHARLDGLDAREGTIAPTAAQRVAATDLGATRVTWNTFGTPHVLINHGGHLAGPRDGAAVDVARGFLREHADLFRLDDAGVAALEVLRDSPLYDTPDLGRVYVDGQPPANPDVAHVVLFQQTFDGLDAGWDGRVTVGVDRDGRVTWVTSTLTGDRTITGAQRLGAVDALQAAAADVDLDLGTLQEAPDATGRWQQFSSDLVHDVQRARLVAVPTPTDGVRLAWKVFLLDTAIDEHGNPTAFLSLVDAATGEVLVRSNRVEHAADGADLGTSVLAQAAQPTGAPFTGETGPDVGSCGPDHVFEVGAGNTQVQVVVNSTEVTGLAVEPFDLRLYLDTNGDGTAQDDELLTESVNTLFGPSTLTYAPEEGLPAGSYVLLVCDGGFELPPTSYAGVFTATAEPVNFDNPRWRVFPANPRFPDHPDPSADTRVLWCWMGEGDVCDEEQANLASRVPWDFRVELGAPTFTTDGNNASTAISELSFLTPDTVVDRPLPDLQRDYQASWDNTWFERKCDPAAFVDSPAGNDDDASMYNLFAMHNRMHDWSYFLGFTEVNGNLQYDNFGATGPDRENDPELGSAQAGRLTFNGRDNANQITGPDGVPGITNQYLWEPLAGAFYADCTDGAYDMAVVAHEYGHAISNRMTDPFVLSGAGSTQGQTESWSDLVFAEYFRGFGITAGPDANPFALAPYVSGDKQAGIRNYAMNDSPLNYSNVDYDGNGRGSPHADGEIWSAVNFAIGEAFNARYDADFPSDDAVLQEDCARGVLPTDACPGNRRWAQLMFDGFLLQGSGASMVDSRDAMLAADMLRFDGANQDLLWDTFARHGLGETAATDGSGDLDPTPGWSSPLRDDDATVRFEAAPVDGSTAPDMEVFVGVYEARITPTADTDPDTPVGDTVAMVPGTYQFIARADGYGAHRFEVTLAPGAEDVVTVPLRPNLASLHAGATATGHGEFPERLIDDSEETNWRSLEPVGLADEGEEGRQVEGRQVTVDLAGDDPVEVTEVQVSAALSSCDPDFLLGDCVESDPDQDGTQSRFSALRSFDLFACDATVADCAADAGWTQVLASPDDAFPGRKPRPRAPDFTLRPFEVTPTTATHVRLVVRDNQCTGGPGYQGDVNPVNDPIFSNPDCDSLATTPDRAVLSPPYDQVRAAELQVFGAPATPDNTAPVADAVAEPTEVAVGEEVTFDATGSTDAETPDQLSHAWDFGDGAGADTAVATHAYDAAGEYTATVTVTDPEGASDQAAVMVTVTDAPVEPVRIECDDPRVVRTGDWTDEESADATNGRYCVGAGARGPNDGAALEVGFRGDEVTIEHGVGPQGTTATVTVDGQVVGEVSFHGPGRGDAVTFGEAATFDGLGDGTHTLRLQVDAADGRRQSAYVDSLVATEFLDGGEPASADAAGVDASLAAASPRRAPASVMLLVLLAGATVVLLRRRA